jgi:predicted transcriptional regulator
VRQKSATLTDQELEIMKAVWEADSVTVRDVYEALRAKRKIAYTTVMTMMNILDQKGHLVKSNGERAYVYRSARSRDKVLRGMVREFVNRVFNGSAEPLLLHLAEDKKLSGKDLDEIRNMIRKALRKKDTE